MEETTKIIAKMDRSSKQTMFRAYNDVTGEFRSPNLTARRRQYLERLGLVRRVDFKSSHIDDQTCQLTALGMSVSRVLYEQLSAYRERRAAMKKAIRDYKADFRNAGAWEQLVLENPVLEKRLDDASDDRLTEVYSILGGDELTLPKNPTAPASR